MQPLQPSDASHAAQHSSTSVHGLSELSWLTGANPDLIDMDSLPGSVTQGTPEPRRPLGHQALVHGAYVHASSMHKSGVPCIPSSVGCILSQCPTLDQVLLEYNAHLACSLALHMLLCNTLPPAIAVHKVWAVNIDLAALHAVSHYSFALYFQVLAKPSWPEGSLIRTNVRTVLAATPQTSVLARSSSSMNGRVEVMMSHLPGVASPAGGTGTPRASFKREMTLKSSMQELVQVSCCIIMCCAMHRHNADDR